MSVYIHINNFIFNLKIKLIMSCQLITLVISNNPFNHFIQLRLVKLAYDNSHVFTKISFIILTII
jgi:hypothetical protein